MRQVHYTRGYLSNSGKKTPSPHTHQKLTED